MSIGAVYDEEAAEEDEKDPGQRHLISNYGVDLELCAVGVYFETSNAESSTSYESVTGTSIATAASAGIIACLIEQIDTVPSNQKPSNPGPAFIESQLRANADTLHQTSVGDGTIRAESSMVNWYDYTDTKTATYGSVSGGIPGAGTASFTEASVNLYTPWNTESFSSVPPSGWSSSWGWTGQPTGGQSGSWAKFEYDISPTGELVSEEYSTTDANYVCLEFYYKMGFAGGTLKVYAYDNTGAWDLVKTCTTRNYWYKASWSCSISNR
jgi:hypothetical protein